jgi:hypothetical protein
MRLMAFALLFLGWMSWAGAASGVAQAAEPSVPVVITEGLSWRWTPGEARRFLLRADVVLPEAIEFNAAVNTDTLVNQVSIGLVVSCAPSATLGKAAWELRCDIDDATLAATPNPQSVGLVKGVAEEWSAVLRDQGWLQVVMGANGRIRSVDLEGTDKRIERLRLITETMRQLILRAFAPMDVELPRDGSDHGTGQWVQRGGIAFMLPSLTGTLGNADVTWTLGTRNVARVLLTSQAKGVIVSSEEFMGNPRNTIAVTMNGTAVFDTAAGTLTQASFRMEGTVTAGSVQAEAREYGYTQTSNIKLLKDGETVNLPAPREEALVP